MQKARRRLGMERGLDEEQNELKEVGQANVGSGAAEHRRKKRKEERGNKRQATLCKETRHPPRTATATVAGASFCYRFGYRFEHATTAASPGERMSSSTGKQTQATFHAKTRDGWASPGARRQLQLYGFRFRIVLCIVRSSECNAGTKNNFGPRLLLFALFCKLCRGNQKDRRI